MESIPTKSHSSKSKNLCAKIFLIIVLTTVLYIFIPRVIPWVSWTELLRSLITICAAIAISLLFFKPNAIGDYANVIIATVALVTFIVTWQSLKKQDYENSQTLQALQQQASQTQAIASATNQEINLLSVQNRPYIGIDASGMAEQLDDKQTDPNNAWNTPDATAYVNGQPDMTELEALDQARTLPEQFNVAFSFTITNFGHLPAEYSVDMRHFHQPGLETPFAPPNATGFISPNQTITIDYQATGYENTHLYWQQEEAYEAAMNLIIPTSSTIFGFLQPTGTYQSEIAIKYGLLNSDALNFETLIKEQPYETNCSSIPTPNTECEPLPQWEVMQAN